MGDAGKPNSNDVVTDTRKKLHWLEIGYFSSQIGLAVIGIWALTIYHGQQKVMQGQLDEMKRSGEQSTSQMWSAIGNMNWMARSMDWNQKVAQNTIESSDKQSKATLQATQDQMRLDQRAWVVLRGIGPGPTLDQPWNLNAVFTNTGKTPAKNVEWSCVNEYAKDESSLKRWRLPYANPTLLAPNDQKMCILHPVTTPKVTQPVLDVLKSSQVQLFVYGSVVYLDVFGQWHWLTFCQKLQPEGQAWDGCTKGDDTGDGRYPPPPFGGTSNAPAGLAIPYNPSN